MAHITVAGNVDASGRGKRLSSWHISQGTGAQIVNFRHGTITGAMIFQVQVPANTSASQSYASPIYVAEGVFVEVVNTGVLFVTVDVN